LQAGFCLLAFFVLNLTLLFQNPKPKTQNPKPKTRTLTQSWDT